MQDEITLRQMKHADGPAIDLLGRQTPDTGAIAFYTRFLHDPYKTLKALHPGMVGVVAEAPGREGLVGMGLLTFGECWYEGELRPYAYLSGLSVHPDHRRRGIASRLAAWRVAAARERLGKDCVIFAGIQGGNVGSLRTAESWSNLRVDGHVEAGVVKMRGKPPGGVPGLKVRPAHPEEYEEVVQKQNAVYRDYNLYPPQTAEGLDRWLARTAFDHHLHDYLVAVDRQGNVIAGMGVTIEGPLISGRVVKMPTPLRVANLFLRVVPPDGMVKRLGVERFWFAPGHARAGRFLWESARWLLRERGTNLMLFFDPHSPLREGIVLPRLAPRPGGGSIVLNAPVPMQEGRLVYWRI